MIRAAAIICSAASRHSSGDSPFIVWSAISFPNIIPPILRRGLDTSGPREQVTNNFMKTAFCFLAAVILLCGCNQKSDPKVVQLEARVAILESNLNTLREVALESMATNQTLIATIQTDLSNDMATWKPLGSMLALLTNAPPEPQHSQPLLDPDTGLPIAANARVVRVANRVTEANTTWWRWSLTVFIANPTGLPMSVNARINFLDRDGFIIDRKNFYGLKLDGQPTNSFSDYALVELPGANRVASIRGQIEE